MAWAAIQRRLTIWNVYGMSRACNCIWQQANFWKLCVLCRPVTSHNFKCMPFRIILINNSVTFEFFRCRWAFVAALSSSSLSDVFVPFTVRIDNLLNAKYSELSATDRELCSASMFSVKTLTSFQELHPFFNALATQHDQKRSVLSQNETIDVELEVGFFHTILIK